LTVRLDHEPGGPAGRGGAVRGRRGRGCPPPTAAATLPRRLAGQAALAYTALQNRLIAPVVTATYAASAIQLLVGLAIAGLLARLAGYLKGGTARHGLRDGGRGRPGRQLDDAVGGGDVGAGAHAPCVLVMQEEVICGGGGGAEGSAVTGTAGLRTMSPANISHWK
jgi:hypothetical protein